MTDVEADICMEVNPVLSSIMARRSIRKYLDKPVEHEKLEVIVKCGINAPSGMNRQPWIVRVVENQKLIADVTEVFKTKNPDMVKRDPNFKNMFRNAPNIICICTPAKGGGEIDAGLLGENMLLAAHSHWAWEPVALVVLFASSRQSQKPSSSLTASKSRRTTS